MRDTGTDLRIVGVVDDGPSEMNLVRLADRDVAYLGTLHSWLAYGDYDCRYVLGIGRPGSGAGEEADIMILLDPEPLLRR